MSRANVPHFKSSVPGLARRGLIVAVLTTGLLLPAMAVAQGKKKPSNEPEKKSGKIFAVEKKGKTANVTVEEADGEKFDVLVAGKMKFIVNGKGDAGFFKLPKAFVSSDSVITSNQQYFGRKFTIHLGTPIPAVVEQDPTNAEVYRVAGPIADADDSSFTINVQGEPCKVNFEQGADLSVTIESTEPEHASVGSPVVVEGMTKGGKFHATAVTVTLDKPLVADDFVSASDKKGAKSKATAASKTAKKPPKTDKGDKGDKGDAGDKGDDAPPAADPLKPRGDPFDVLNKKDPKKKPGTAPKPNKPKKPTEDGESQN